MFIYMCTCDHGFCPGVGGWPLIRLHTWVCGTAPGNIESLPGATEVPQSSMQPHEGLRNKASSCAPHAVAQVYGASLEHNEVEGVPLPQSFSKHMLEWSPEPSIQ